MTNQKKIFATDNDRKWVNIHNVQRTENQQEKNEQGNRE